MSSSSTTACSRSPSPSPATPESQDSLEPCVNREDLSAWCHSLSPSSFLVGNDAPFSDSNKAEDSRILDIAELLQDSAYDDSSSSQGPDAHIKPDSRFSNVASSSPAVEMPTMLHSSASMTKPVPPPPSQPRKDPSATAQRVVYPSKESCYNLPIIVPSIPEGGTKSRVETQVRLTVDLAHASASSGEPFKYDRVGSWKWIRLPKGTSTKKRTRKEGKVEAPLEDSLYLTAEVSCASPPHTRVTCCSSCQAREAKRVARKIAARVRPVRSDSESQDDVRTIPGRGRHEDTSNIVQFNCPEVLDFSSGSVILPLRITCYCRHHREKVGFNVHFTMLDHSGRVVGTGVTRPIMITDDHKSTGINAAQKTGMILGGIDTLPNFEYSMSPVADVSEASGSVKRKKARGDHGSERIKKRTKPYDVERSSTRLGRCESSGSLDSPSNMASAFVTRSSTPLQSFASSPISHFGSSEQASPAPDMLNGGEAPPASSPSFDISASLVDHHPSANFDHDIPMSEQFDTQTMSQALCLEDLTAPFMPPVPSSPLPLSLNPNQTMNMPPQSLPFMLFNHDPPPNPGLPLPKIHRMIPSSGPTFGGVEVTVLGANFHPNLQLSCVFGGMVSSSTQRWSDNTLVCVLPPSATAGTVPVWFQGLQKEEDGTPPCLFTYTDETDRALMELALQVVGLKMTGKVEDARNVALRIVGNTDTPGAEGAMGSGGAMQFATDVNLTRDMRHLMLSRSGDNSDFEKLILNFLAVLDVPVDRPSASLHSSLSHPTSSGQTLLHLATLLKFSALVGFLIERGIDIDARDKNGCTALFFAAVTRSTQCAKLLVEAGAALDIVDALGKTPAEVAPAGFFDFMSADSERGSESDTHDDESAWGDVDSEDEVEVKRVTRRRSERKLTHRKPKSSYIAPDVDSKKEQHPSAKTAESKKALEAGLTDADQKQAVASFMETLFRTLGQFQHPQGMIANIPNLPLPHLPNFPPMAAWNALPQQMQAVFPVFVPMPAFSAIWGEKRNGEQGQDADGKGAAMPPWLGIPTAQDWRAMWEKWLQATLIARTNDESVDAPPAYSPRTDKIEKTPALEVKEDTPSASSSALQQPSAFASERVMSRRFGYEPQPIPEQEVKSYAYRPARKTSHRLQKKNDRMLVLFWLPILLIGVTWAFLHFVRVAFHATRAVVSIKAGLRA
ncbi:hypothetical protein B0H21DRAFT_716410 [Amylocystis lapponica]|nr:hypothetical protein B0H21DRAFT_716410 [Amylocystis lapponica]